MRKTIEINTLVWILIISISLAAIYLMEMIKNTRNNQEVNLDVERITIPNQEISILPKEFTINLTVNKTESENKSIEEAKELKYEIYIREISNKCYSIKGRAYLFSKDGFFEADLNNSIISLKRPFNGNLSILFSLEDGNCKIENVPKDYKVVISWQNVSDNETLFFNISEKSFRFPDYPIEVTNYVRPKDVKWFLNSFLNQIPQFEYDALDYIKRRTEVEVRYYFDMGEDWQFPNETLRRGYGDCEDFSTLLLSLFKAYNEELKCYNLLLYRHLSTFCILYFEKDYPTFAFFDQGETRIRENWYRAVTNYEKCSIIKRLVDSFYSVYGLPFVENKVLAAFDDKEIYLFEDMNEFCDWIIKIA